MKNKSVILAIMIMALTAGCANSAANTVQNEVKESSDSSSENSAKETSDEASEPAATSSASDADEVSSDNEAETNAPKESEDQPDTDEKSADNIEGNGSYFVKRGSSVYFHKYESSAFEKIVYEGDFLGYTKDSDEDTALYLYDEESCEAKELIKDGCTGKLYLCGDKFYCEKQVDGYSQIWTIAPDGRDAGLFGPGYIRGISDDGKQIAMQMLSGDDLVFRIYDEEGNLSFEGPDDSEGRVFYCGFSKGKLIYGKATSDEAKLYYTDGDGEVLIGTIPGISGFGGPECDRFIDAQDKFFCLFGYYGGPVDMIEDYYVVEATTNEGSLRVVQHGYDERTMPDVRDNAEPFIRLDDGYIAYGPYMADSVYMDHSSGIKKHYSEVKFRYGDLYYYGEDGSSLKLKSSFIKLSDIDRLFLQTAQVLGDYVYMMVGRAFPLPEEDYNVYRAFEYNDMYYIRMPIKEDSVAESILGPDFNEAEIVDMGDIFIGEGVPVSVFWEDMRYYLEGNWKLAGDDDGEKTSEGLEMSFAENGMATLKKGEGSAMFSYIISDLFDEPLYLSNRLELLGLRISDSFTDRADELLGHASSFQIVLVNDRGSDCLILREIGEGDHAFTEVVSNAEKKGDDFLIFKRAGGDKENRLKSSYGHDEMLRMFDHSFTAFMISDSKKSCTLVPVELSLVEGNDRYLAYRPLDKGYGLSSVEYAYASHTAARDEMSFAPGLVNVTTDDDGRIIQIKRYTYAENGCYFIDG